MATQLDDGSWTEIENLPDALKTFANKLEKGQAKRFIVGDKNEVQEEMNEIEEQESIESLQQRLDSLEQKVREQESQIEKPTPDEVIKYGEEDSSNKTITP